MTIKNNLKVTLALPIFSFCFSLVISAQTLTVRDIMAEPSIAGMRVEGERLSPDGTKVIYLWNPENKLPRSLYIQSTTGGTATKLLSPNDLPPPTRPPERENNLNYGLELRDDFVKARENALGNFEWSPDSKKLVFTHGGDLYVLTLGDEKPKRYTKTQPPESGPRFLDNDRILFSLAGNAFVLNTVDSTLVQLTRESNPTQFISVGSIVPNKAGTMIAYVVSDGSKQRQLIVPNYLPEFVTAGGPRRGWTEQKLCVTAADGSRETPFEIKLPKAEGVSGFRRMVWNSDSSALIVDRVDKDTKRRQLFFVNSPGSKSEQIITVSDDTDEKWQASLSIIFEPNPKNPGELFFGSEKDGFNHLYLAKLTPTKTESTPGGAISAEGGTSYSSNVAVTQLTRGNWQVEWAKWVPSGVQVLFLSTEQGYQGRQFSVADAGELTGFNKLNTMYIPDPKRYPGMKSNPQFEGATLIFGYSEWNKPEELMASTGLNTSRLAGDDAGNAHQLSNTIPDRFSQIKWAVPKFVEIISRDGKKIPAKIYLPAGHDPKKKYPMAIFVHGAGYLQNTINGWNNYYREFMFNDMLTRKGYVVLDIDYRGSAGYGRDWRTDVYDFLGGKDFDDHIDAIDFMVKNYGVDQKRIGAYGGSYGGFMAAMLATRAPERIAAAAALRPVMDWKNYYAANPGYTAQRLGFPDKNPEAYKRSSPIAYADKLERPLLILHGMVDDNVHVQDSVQFIEKLIRLGKTRYFETMMYPSENHGFVRPENWADEYERILALFEKYLK